MTDKSFQLGDIVFAKLKGHRHWPALISEIVITENKPLKFKITFFGDNTSAEVRETNLFSYSENIHIFGVQGADNFKNKIFNRALKEAELASKTKDTTLTPNEEVYKTLHSQQDNLQIENNSYSAEVDPPHIQDCTENISTKLQNIQNADLETSLTLAAEVGSALLAENSKLKKDMYETVLKNNQLAKYIADSTDFGQMKYIAQIEELETEKETLSERIIYLMDTIQQLEKQLLKEKKMQNELELMYIEQDNEKERIICNLEKETARLQEIIKQHSQRNSCEPQIDLKTHTLRDSETQTLTTDLNTLTQPSSIIHQLGELKVRQDQLEQQINTLYGKSQYQETFDTMSVGPTSKLRSENHFKLKNSPLNNKSHYKKKNHFSVSLQVLKSKEFLKTSTDNMNVQHSSHSTCNRTEKLADDSHTLPRKKGNPPISAIKLREGQTHKEFLTEHLDKIGLTNPVTLPTNLHRTATEGARTTLSKKLSNTTTEGVCQTLSKKQSTATSSTTKRANIGTDFSFLDTKQIKKARHKQSTYKTKIFVNSMQRMRMS